MIRAIRRHATVGVLPLLLSEIVLLFGCFYLSAEILYPPSAWFYLFLEGGISLVALAIGTILLCMYVFDMYADGQVTSRVLLIQQICQALGVAILAQTVTAYLFRDWTVPQLMMLYSCGFSLVLLFGWRILFSAVLKRIGPIEKLLFVGRNATSDAVAAAIEANPRAGYRIIGFVDDNCEGQTVLGGFGSLREVVAQYKPNLLVVGMPERRASMPVGDLVALRFSGLQIEEASTTYESVCHRIRLEDLSEQQVMFSRAFAPSSGALNLARFINVLMAVFFFVLAFPVFVLIWLLLRLSGKDPAIERLPRMGKDGREFQMLRFRRPESLRKFFDRFRLDALPELVNVFRGEMSFVGPLAEELPVARMLDESLPFHHYRTAVPPGITGWAKINQRPENRDDCALALEYELYYIKHLSQALNLYILVHSLKNRVLRP